MDNEFRTVVELEKPLFEITYKSPLMFIGSCFSDNIGSELKRFRLPVLLNPFGVQYNPVSIEQSLHLIIDNSVIDLNQLVHHKGLWHSFQLHGSFSHPEKEVLIETANEAVRKSHVFLKNASYLLVTFGTAWVFKHKQMGRVVSNCHKIHAKDFDRYRLKVTDIALSWNILLKKLRKFNPELKIIFTVSPVRHFKDGAHENQLGKSTLFLAIDEIRSGFPPEITGYFPSYEIVNDELRDYRFYAEDMIHISPSAVKYIMKKFSNVYFSKSTQMCLGEMEKLAKAVEHKVEGASRNELEVFKERMIKKVNELDKKYPFINFRNEKNYFQNL
jgi:hypothetical protein